MLLRSLILVLGAFLSSPQLTACFDLSSLQSYLIPYLEVIESKEKTAIAIVPAKASCSYLFHDILSQRDTCELYDDQSYIMKSAERSDNRIRVKCVTDQNNRTEKVQIMDSVKATISMLSPFGNTTTKRTDPGNCVVLLFFSRTCPGSATIAPHYNALQRQFPYLRVLAIDAFKHRNLNTEFGVTGLPSIVLFHNGRPLVKFNETLYNLNNFVKFVTKHTDIRPSNRQIFVTSDDFLGPLSAKVEKETDIWLIVAWLFIIVCSCYYASKSALWKRITQTIVRNWTEAQHEN